MDDKPFFYIRQRPGEYRYRLLLGLWAFFFLLCVGALLSRELGSSASGGGLAPGGAIALGAAALVCAGAFLATRRVFLPQRAALYKQYEALPYHEKRRLDAELAQKFRTVGFGETNLYFCSRGYLHFIAYADIARAFRQDVRAPFAVYRAQDVSARPEPLLLSSSLIVHDAAGHRYKIRARKHAAAWLNAIGVLAPSAAIDYGGGRGKPAGHARGGYQSAAGGNARRPLL